jgi:hypothetical protein
MRKLIYGTDSLNAEDYDQCIILVVPSDTDYTYIIEGADPDELPDVVQQTIVSWEDTVDAFLLAMMAEGLDHDTRARIVTTVRDAVDNND